MKTVSVRNYQCSVLFASLSVYKIKYKDKVSRKYGIYEKERLRNIALL
jgi:hypothetical protein